MTATALGLVITAAFFHAIWNVAAKTAGGDARFALLSSLLVIAVWSPLTVWSAWSVVGGWGVTEWAVLAASAIVHVTYFLTLLRGYRSADLTVVYPIARGTAPLLSAVVALVLFGERLSAVSVLGVVGVVVGVFLVAGGPGLFRTAFGSAARRHVWTESAGVPPRVCRSPLTP